jgi:hypothetical protein
MAGIGLHHAEEHFDKCRFAGPVAAQKAIDTASGYAEIDDIDNTARAVMLGEAVDGDGVHGSERGVISK